MIVLPGEGEVLLTRILAVALEVCATAKGCIQALDSAGRRARVVTQRGLGEAFQEHLARAELSPPAATGRFDRWVIPDVSAAGALPGPAAAIAYRDENIQAEVVVNLLSRAGETLGRLNLYFPAAHLPEENEGRMLQVLARMAADFIALRQAEESRRQSEERARALFEVSRQAFFRMNPDWTEMRPLSCAGDFGHPPEVDPEWLRSHVFPEDHPRVLAAIDTARRTGQPAELEHRIWRRDRGVGWVLSRAVPLRDPAGTIVEWVGAVSDITERRRAEAELRRHQSQLEERVLERTAELGALNGALRDEIAERGRAQRQHLDLLRRLASAQEDERRRISRELHDEIGQLVASLLLNLADLAERHGIPETSETLQQLRTTTHAIAREVHHLAVELRPTALDDLGLGRALAAYTEYWSSRTKIQAAFHAAGFDPRARLDPNIESTLYRIVQEALNNVFKHARAREVSIVLARKPGEVSAIIEDDGIGFDPDLPRKTNQLGILGMSERAALVGGQVRIESAAGRGATVLVRIPLEGTAAP